ncbi:DsbA family protein [Tepidicaulis sp.]|uniref:DsbA family protein n=1 Tax=Tepidicaulis sp. TaxID=1920809 RepID=UPI003B5945BA
MTHSVASPTKRLPLYLAAFIGALSVAGVLFVAESMAADSSKPVREAAVSKEQAEIEKIVREYILREPEILLEALTILEERQAASADMEQQRQIAENADALYYDPNSFVAGNPDGDVTIVEFFDYQCGYCKRSVQRVMNVLEEDGNVRLVLKEFPILGETSVFASRAAIAAIPQGKYMDLHVAMLKSKGELTEGRVLRMAEEVGIDVERLKKDMKDARVSETIEANYDMARLIGVEGTPAFIIGTTFAPGAIDKEEMTRLIEEARASAS